MYPVRFCTPCENTSKPHSTTTKHFPNTQTPFLEIPYESHPLAHVSVSGHTKWARPGKTHLRFARKWVLIKLSISIFEKCNLYLSTTVILKFYEHFHQKFLMQRLGFSQIKVTFLYRVLFFSVTPPHCRKTVVSN